MVIGWITFLKNPLLVTPVFATYFEAYGLSFGENKSVSNDLDGFILLGVVICLIISSLYFEKD